MKAQEEEDSDHAQKRTTRGRQISYKELISSGDSQDEDGNTAKKMGTLFAADRIRNMPGAAIRGGSSRRGGRGGVITQAPGRANVSGDDCTPVPVSVISSRIGVTLNQDDESRFSGSTDTIEFSSAVASATAAASAYTTGDESHTSTDIVTPSIDPDLSTLPLVLPQEDEASPIIKDELPAIVPVPVLSQDLQVNLWLIFRRLWCLLTNYVVCLFFFVLFFFSLGFEVNSAATSRRSTYITARLADQSSHQFSYHFKQ